MEASTIYAIVLAALGGIFLLSSALVLDMKRFLDRVSTLSSEADLEALRRVAARNMYAALIVIAVVAPAVLLVAAALYQSWLGTRDLEIILLAGLPFTFMAVWTRSFESRVKSTPAATEALREQRDKVVRAWDSRLLPDW